MPYLNDGKQAKHQHLRGRGFDTKGLSTKRSVFVKQYKEDYTVHNTFSPYHGAIVVTGAAYIHAGPKTVTDAGWGAAGCVEVIGDFNRFKQDILSCAGHKYDTNALQIAGLMKSRLLTLVREMDKRISDLVKRRKLLVLVEAAVKPRLKVAFESSK